MTGFEVVQISRLPGIEMALAEVHEQAFQKPWPADSIATLLQQPGVSVWAAKNANRDKDLGQVKGLLGFVMGRQAGPEIEILTIAVCPAARRKGAGKALMETVCGLANGKDASVFLEVNEANGPAIALYRALGFETVGRRAKYYKTPDGAAADALIMAWRKACSD